MRIAGARPARRRPARSSTWSCPPPASADGPFFHRFSVTNVLPAVFTTLIAVTSPGGTAAEPLSGVPSLAPLGDTTQPPATSPVGLLRPTTINRQFSPAGMFPTSALTRTHPAAGTTVASIVAPGEASVALPDRVPDGSGDGDGLTVITGGVADPAPSMLDFV